MLFDLRGKRRRFIQVVYAFLALLLGGGLVIFGIGGDASGGIADMFGLGTQSSGVQGGGDQIGQFEEREDELLAQLERRPGEPALLAELARARFNLANAKADEEVLDSELGAEGTVRVFTPESRRELRRAAAAWEQHVEAAGGPEEADAGLAQLMITAYGELNDPSGAAEAAVIVAQDRPSPNSLFTAARFSYFAGEEEAADRFARRAVELAPELEEQIAETRAEAKQYRDAVEAGEALEAEGQNPLSQPLGGQLGG